MFKTRRRSVRVLTGVAGLATVCALGFGILYLSSWRVRTVVKDLVEGRSRQFAWLRELGREVVIREAPALVGDHYPAPDTRPLVIIAHGSSPRGRQAGVPSLLARRLHSAGLPVLAVDLRGFGDSQDPDLPLDPDFMFEDDLAAAAQYALQTDKAPQGQFAYLGHSLGAGAVLHAAKREPRPCAVIALGAPSNPDRLRLDGGNEFDEFVTRRFRDMRLVPDDTSLSVMARYLLSLDAARDVGFEEMPPVLLTYGEAERTVRRSLVNSFVSRGEYQKVVVVPKANHSYNISPRIGPWVFHDESALSQLVSEITTWVDHWCGASQPPP